MYGCLHVYNVAVKLHVYRSWQHSSRNLQNHLATEHHHLAATRLQHDISISSNSSRLRSGAVDDASRRWKRNCVCLLTAALVAATHYKQQLLLLLAARIRTFTTLTSTHASRTYTRVGLLALLSTDADALQALLNLDAHNYYTPWRNNVSTAAIKYIDMDN